MAIFSCRHDDDVVAITLPPKDASNDATPPPIDDGGSRLDVSSEDNAAPPPPPMDGEVPPPPADIVSDIVIPPPPVDAPTIMCDATGPILSVFRMNGERSEVCAGQLAAHTFTHALCACGDLALGSVRLTTASFDSSAADKSPVEAAAAVGIKGNYPPVGASIGGSLTVAGTAPPRAVASSYLEVQGDLRFAGQMTFTAGLTVRRDAWIASKIWFLPFAFIHRDLYSPAGSGLFPLGLTYQVGGMSYVRPVTIEDPCGCSDRLDIAMMETVGAEINHNALHNIDRAALSNVTTAVPPLRLCGRFRFNSIGGTAPIHLIITGRTAIFVDADVMASDSFVLEIAGPNAEVDWFIRGNLSVGTNAKIGDRTRPSATRIYVAGTQDIQLSPASIGANIYAPDTNIGLAAGALSGSVYGNGLSMPSGTGIYYDRAILNQGDKCEPLNTCSKCRYCNGGEACKNGTCGMCSTDEDCCAPLVCDQTSRLCQPLLSFR